MKNAVRVEKIDFLDESDDKEMNLFQHKQNYFYSLFGSDNFNDLMKNIREHFEKRQLFSDY